MTFQEALNKALVEQKGGIKRKAWQSGVLMRIEKNKLDFQHSVTCSLTGPKPFEYLENDWFMCDSLGNL